MSGAVRTVKPAERCGLGSSLIPCLVSATTARATARHEKAKQAVDELYARWERLAG